MQNLFNIVVWLSEQPLIFATIVLASGILIMGLIIAIKALSLALIIAKKNSPDPQKKSQSRKSR